MNYLLLSKKISHALRHEPEKYGLELEENGWCDLECLISGINSLFPDLGEVSRHHIEYVVNIFGKKRHEISGNKIRALYGHSIQVEIGLKSIQPPDILFHGTCKESGANIIVDGIRKMDRQFVHLFSNVEDASIISRRRGGEKTIVEVNSCKAFRDGLLFFRAGHVWLTVYVPSIYIKLLNEVKS